MRGDPARDMNPNSGDFAGGRVYAREAFDAKRFDSKIRHRANQDLFQIANEAMHVFAIRAEINDWITYDLAQTMIGRLATAICFKDGDATCLQHI
jgi:hypothetical protein